MTVRTVIVNLTCDSCGTSFEEGTGWIDQPIRVGQQSWTVDLCPTCSAVFQKHLDAFDLRSTARVEDDSGQEVGLDASPTAIGGMGTPGDTVTPDLVCPECGRSFATAHGLRVHTSRVHATKTPKRARKEKKNAPAAPARRR